MAIENVCKNFPGLKDCKAKLGDLQDQANACASTHKTTPRLALQRSKEGEESQDACTERLAKDFPEDCYLKGTDGERTKCYLEHYSKADPAPAIKKPVVGERPDKIEGEPESTLPKDTTGKKPAKVEVHDFTDGTRTIKNDTKDKEGAPERPEPVPAGPATDGNPAKDTSKDGVKGTDKSPVEKAAAEERKREEEKRAERVAREEAEKEKEKADGKRSAERARREEADKVATKEPDARKLISAIVSEVAKFLRMPSGVVEDKIKRQWGYNLVTAVENLKEEFGTDDFIAIVRGVVSKVGAALKPITKEERAAVEAALTRLTKMLDGDVKKYKIKKISAYISIISAFVVRASDTDIAEKLTELTDLSNAADVAIDKLKAKYGGDLGRKLIKGTDLKNLIENLAFRGIQGQVASCFKEWQTWYKNHGWNIYGGIGITGQFGGLEGSLKLDGNTPVMNRSWGGSTSSDALGGIVAMGGVTKSIYTYYRGKIDFRLYGGADFMFQGYMKGNDTIQAHNQTVSGDRPFPDGKAFRFNAIVGAEITPHDWVASLYLNLGLGLVTMYGFPSGPTDVVADSFRDKTPSKVMNGTDPDFMFETGIKLRLLGDAGIKLGYRYIKDFFDGKGAGTIFLNPTAGMHMFLIQLFYGF